MMIDMKGRPLKVANYKFENVARNAADNELWHSGTWKTLDIFPTIQHKPAVSPLMKIHFTLEK